MRKILFQAALLPLLFIASGCATSGSSDSSLEEPEIDDPVARAALSLRPSKVPHSTLSEDTPETDPQTANGWARREIVPGMSMTQVRSLWGEPSEIHVAGTSTSGNERWIYHDGLIRFSISSARVIYFERGRVAGWNTMVSQ